jgi:ADP-ribose pyrophosphatase YjhB (NUDIX family)
MHFLRGAVRLSFECRRNPLKTIGGYGADIIKCLSRGTQTGMAALHLNRLIFSMRMLTTGLVAPTTVGALALVEHEGKIVLVRQSYAPGWRLPGGGAKHGEPPQVAVMRELQEEIGLISSSEPELFGVYVNRAWPAVNLVVLYRVAGARYAFKPNWEIREATLADPAAPPQGVTDPTRRRLAEWAARATCANAESDFARKVATNQRDRATDRPRLNVLRSMEKQGLYW